MKHAPAIAIVLKKHKPLPSILLGVLIYAIGLLISSFYGATSFYLRDLFFPAVCLGIIIVSYHYVWLFFDKLEQAITELEQNFDVPKEEFREIKLTFFKRVCSDKMSLLVSIPGFALIFYLIYQIWNGNLIYFGKLPLSLQGNIAYFSFSTIVSCFGMYLILAPSYMMVCTLYALRKVTAYPAKLRVMQKKNRFHLNKNLSLNLRVVLVWFVGLSLMMVNFLTLSGYMLALGLLLVLLFGIAIFFIPQFLFRKSILLSKEKLLTDIESDLLSNTSILLPFKSDSQKSLLLYMLYERTEKISEWTLNTEPIMQLILYAIILVLTTIVGTLIK